MGNLIQLFDTKGLAQISKLELFEACHKDGRMTEEEFRAHWPATSVNLLDKLWQWPKGFFNDEFKFFLEHNRVRTKGERYIMNMPKKKVEPTYIGVVPSGRFLKPIEIKAKDYSSADKDCSSAKSINVSFDPFLTMDPVLTFTKSEVSRRAPKPQEVTKTNGEDPMYFHFDTRQPLEQQQIEFAFNYASTVVDEARSTLQKKYNLFDENPPADAEEFIERIKAGKFTLLDKETDNRWRSEFQYIGDEYGYDAPRRIVWRSPDRVKDMDGYEKANDALVADHLELKKTIMAGDYAKSLAAIDALKAKYGATVH